MFLVKLLAGWWQKDMDEDVLDINTNLWCKDINILRKILFSVDL